MKGYNVLWQPGTDHAGIATQNVVERELALKGTNRHEVGREKFIQLVWEWKAKYGGMDASALRRLKELEAENQRLKRMYAELSLDHQILKDLVEKKL